MKPRIGIAANERTVVDGETFWLSYTAKNFVEGIQQAGGLPLLLPIGDPEDAKDYINQVDKLFLGGGHDVSPQFYHQAPSSYLEATNEARDRFELALIKEAVAQGKPIFGVCRGMQLLNVAFDGTLYQDLSAYPNETLPHVQHESMAKVSHEVTIEKNSHLGNFLPEHYQVNSFHHQTIDRVATPFKVIARATDGVIEAIESQGLASTILAVQWHPELTRAVIAREQQIFDYFVQSL
ncbi:gamma-glutamyl-gamma-aminobutyrate hydrolase family protein [Enterococcus saccharolyticus]|uniref:Gamma-glutamyl-gamma-aminobutyrate hydrolase n=1 Tax=Candidatus Enterococcus willemsii TaxID=1857215 RepID=A0ABQ6Z1H1_9ENTE|nr:MULTISPECIES: gamma-glutamyl-gamma-aminobutyrate hydrolase family protein [Enterococcus]KAF1305132.1 gamma-glutamyl-gamma-aminobutyrate hydrolase [Enterococcus sp. CU12B]MCD5002492.1 gamma-glutamyl-gamma-aminobutyrate hydrolase family protein [Enterococcus saccharolyticus]